MEVFGNLSTIKHKAGTFACLGWYNINKIRAFFPNFDSLFRNGTIYCLLNSLLNICFSYLHTHIHYNITLKRTLFLSSSR